MFCLRRAPLNPGAVVASSTLRHHPCQSRESGFVQRPKSVIGSSIKPPGSFQPLARSGSMCPGLLQMAPRRPVLDPCR